MYQAMANVTAHDSNAAELHRLVREVEAAQVGEDTATGDVPVSEALALALLDACKSVKAGDLVSRVLELHRSACAGAPGAKVIAASCSAYIACECLGQACDVYEKEMVPKGTLP